MTNCWLCPIGTAARGKPGGVSPGRQAAFTLIELLIVLVLIGALSAIAIPNYQSYQDRARNAQAIVDIKTIAQAIEIHYVATREYPPSLPALGIAIPTDPWGNAYAYLRIATTPPPNVGQVRKDKNLNPLNSDYDLYSMGPDGKTQKQLTAAKARDDIVRAGNGGFVGVASQH